jgi:hypothetical protein
MRLEYDLPEIELRKMEIDELIKNRKEFVEAQIKNGFDLTTVLVGLYSDASHFVYEILQNSEDAKATQIKFELFHDKLIITHNGTPFNSADIEAITGISNIQNDKKRDFEKIGKFGIGFKSVYAVTDSPRIQSGKYDFEIINFVLPNKFSDTNNFPETTIILAFKHQKHSAQEIFELIKNKFEHFEFYNLLFLSHLQSITLQWEGTKKQFNKTEKQIKGSNVAYDSVISVDRGKHKYLLFKNDVQHSAFSRLKNKPQIAIAFKINNVDEHEEIIKADSSNLFAFFETGYETFLNFLLQAPFTTTPARDNIDFKLKVNLALLDELCDLMKNVLEHFKNNKLIAVNFLNQLPIDSSIEESKLVYRKLFEAVKTELSSGKKYLPSMFKNQYQAAEDLAIVRGKELTSVISKVEDLQILFGKKYWMDTKITVDRTPALLEYLTNELKIKEYTPDDFARKVTEEFLKSKPDNWIQRFYEFLNGKQESLWRSGRGKDEGALRRKPFIRLSNGEQTTPFDTEGKPKVFLQLSKRQMEYDTVSPKVVNSKASLNFIKNKLGIKEPNPFDEIKHHIIPLYQAETTYPHKPEHIKHFKLILEIYASSNEVVKGDLVELFNNTNVNFIQATNAKTEEQSYQNYQFVYLQNPSLKKYFRFSENIYFLNEGAYTSLPQEQFLTFLKKCGVKDYAWKIEFDPIFSEEKKQLLRLNSSYKSDEITSYHVSPVTDYKLEGLDDILGQEFLSEEDSKLIWEIVITCIKNDSNLFRGKYKWFRNYERHTTFESHLLKCLKNNSWLYTAEGNKLPQMPSEILLKDLLHKYDTHSEEAITLIEQLKFKTEAEKLLVGQMPAERREMFNQFDAVQKLCDEKGIDLLTALNELITEANREEEKKELENAPELTTVEAEEEVFESFDDSNVDVDVIGDDSKEDKNGEGKGKGSTSKPKGNQMSQEMKNQIGNRGETIVFNFLKTKWNKKATLISEAECEMTYQDKEGHKFIITILNTEGKKGIGCDILIKNEETIYEYIEVKSSKLVKKDLFPVNGYQWSLAQKVFKQGEGNKYFFYVVKDVLSDKPKVTPIKNPIKKWKDGELRAHPVNLEL